VVWQRIAVILVLAFVGNIFFWTAFEQAGSSLNVFAKNSTDRTLGGLFGAEGFPASWYQSMNPLTILVFAPVFAWLWMFLDRHRLNPSTPAKFFWGLFLLGMAFIGMVFGATQARYSGLAGPQWLVITYVVYTWGELCLSPVGLSMVTKLAPARLQSLMMGIWFFTFSLANLLAGLVARFSKRLEAGEVSFVLEGLPGFYLMLVVFPMGAAALILLLTPLLKRMMHGVK
jgi:POT family proton-dependent oligopeptide transporter